MAVTGRVSGGASPGDAAPALREAAADRPLLRRVTGLFGPYRSQVIGVAVLPSLRGLSEALRPVNDLDLTDRMAYRYPPGAVRRLDDALLAAFGGRCIGLHGNSHRVPSLGAGLGRLPGPDTTTAG